ncbi:MAG: hypothetical protein NC131_12885 [Roseburia sp.]|nr:hypothetical protein [Roseburia sp.]
MTPEQFWHGDPDLFPLYHRAYYRRLHEQAHAQGYYGYIAVSTALANAFRKKGQKAQQYLSKPFDPFEKKITKANVRQVYKKQARQQIGWLNGVAKN